MWKRVIVLSIGSQYIMKQFGELNRRIFLFGSTRKAKIDDPFLNRKVPWYIIRGSSKFKFFWNMVLLFLLVYTATVVPYRTAFVDIPSIQMVIFDAIIDFLFIADLFINFLSAYDIDENKEETRLKKIWINYFKSWFVLEFLACIPLQYFMQTDTSNSSG